MNSINLAFYENEILNRFCKNKTGIDLSSIGTINSSHSYSIDKNSNQLIDKKDFDHLFNEYDEFLKIMFTYIGTRALWFRFNIDILDKYSENVIIGIGMLDRFTNWLRFILIYLYEDKSYSNNDGHFIIFDTDFNWALSFVLSQKNDLLKVELYANWE